MKFRKLRIAWSVGCGILCLLLIILWVRSYSHSDELTGTFGNHLGFVIQSEQGQMRYGKPWDEKPSWNFDSSPLGDDYPPSFPPMGGFDWPLWLAVLLTGTLIVIPWLRWRFTLRTLLIATTLVAVVLGLIVWLSR
jgi:hypothetical protein